MASKKVGTLIKEARAEAGLTQEQLAKKIKGVTASDISKTERGEKDLTQAQLKEAAKALGITQASLLNAPKNTSGKTTAAKKTTAKKTSSSKTSSSGTSMKVSATEKRLVGYYRDADSDVKKVAMSILKSSAAGEKPELGDLLPLLGMLAGKEGKTGKKDDDLGGLLSMLNGKNGKTGKKDDADLGALLQTMLSGKK